MQNILSYVATPVDGSLIKQWIQYHLTHDTEYSRIARNFSRRYSITLKDEKQYILQYHPEATGCGQYSSIPNIINLYKSTVSTLSNK